MLKLTVHGLNKPSFYCLNMFSCIFCVIKFMQTYGLTELLTFPPAIALGAQTGPAFCHAKNRPSNNTVSFCNAAKPNGMHWRKVCI